MSERRWATGRLAAVQEHRFRLTTDRGQSLLLTLSHGDGTDMETLNRWQADGTRVGVEYEGEPGLASARVHRIWPA